MSAEASSTGGRIVGLFGLFFAGLALVFGWMFLGNDLRDAWRLRSFVEVPGSLIEVSGHPRGVGARYHYLFGGRRY